MQYDRCRMYMRKLFYLITLVMVLAAAPAMALKVSEINPDLTRSQADRTLSKDYTYQVLDDFTVRRTWVISSSKRISLDFNPQNEQLLMVMLEYGSGTDPQKAAADVRRITGAGKTKWKRMDKKKAEKYDVPVNTNNAKSGKCFAFMEMTKSNKCKRVMLYTSLPDSNRSKLGVADTRNAGETALGTRAGASVGKVIAEQEAKRKNTPLAVKGVNVPSSSSSPSVTVRRTSADKTDQSSATPVTDTQQTVAADTEAEQEEEIEDDFEEIKVESRFSLSAIQASIGLQGVSPAMLIGGAIGVIVLLTLIGMLRGSNERKRLSRYRRGRY